MTARPVPSSLVAAAVAAGLLSSGFAIAAADQAPPAWQPKAMTFPGGRVTLLEAVRLTLQNDPTIRVQEQRSRAQKGLAQSEAGQFDASITGDATWTFTQQALKLSQIQSETKNRTDLEKDLAEEKAKADAADPLLREGISELNRLAAAPDTYVSSSLTIRDIQTQVNAINRQLTTETNPFKRELLLTQRAAIIQGGLVERQQNLLHLRDDENAIRDRRARLGDVPRTEQQNSVALNVQATIPYRDGVIFGAFASGSFDEDRYVGKKKNAEDGGTGIEDVYRYEVGFTLDAALLRGRGSDATAAFERSANIDYDASRSIFKHAISTAVLNTISAYWNLVSAQELLDISKKSAALHAKRVEVTKSLIAGDEIPRVELSRALASQASDEALVANAERSVSEARVTLARAMGLAVLDDSNTPLAVDPFPQAPAAADVAAIAPSELIPVAIEKRHDRQAAARLQESGGVLLRAAETALRPRLDLSTQLSANAVAETSFAKTVDGWAAPSFRVGLSFEKPIGNNAAKGRLLQSDADLAQRAISAADLDRNIKANVVQVLYSLRETVNALAKSQEAIRLYGDTVEAETEKFRHGQSTVIDTILTQDLQTNALFTYTTTRQQYASLLARLRFETGTLVGEAGEGNVVRQEDLVSLPRGAGKSRGK